MNIWLQLAQILIFNILMAIISAGLRLYTDMEPHLSILLAGILSMFISLSGLYVGLKLWFKYVEKG